MPVALGPGSVRRYQQLRGRRTWWGGGHAAQPGCVEPVGGADARRVNSSTDTEVILEEIAHGVVDVPGYGVAAIARLEGDVLVMTNVAGPSEVVAQILYRRTPAEQILDEFREADKWGILRFVPAGRMSAARLQAAWISRVPADR